MYAKYPEIRGIADKDAVSGALILKDVANVGKELDIIDTFTKYLSTGNSQLELNNLRFKAGMGTADENDLQRMQELEKKIEEDSRKNQIRFLDNPLAYAVSGVASSASEMWQSIYTGLEDAGAWWAAGTWAGAAAGSALPGPGTAAGAAAGGVIGGAIGAVKGAAKVLATKEARNAAIREYLLQRAAKTTAPNLMKLGAQAGAFSGMATPEAGERYAEYSELKDKEGNPLMSKEEAWHRALLGGSANAALEVMPTFGVLGNMLKGAPHASKVISEIVTANTANMGTKAMAGTFAKKYGKNVLKIAGVESGEEGIQAITDDLLTNDIKNTYGRAYTGKDGKLYYTGDALSAYDIVTDGLKASLQALPSSFIFGAAGGFTPVAGMAGRYAARARHLSALEKAHGEMARQTYTGTVMAEQLQQAVHDSRLKDTAPDVQRKLIKEKAAGTGFETVYIDTELALEKENGQNDLEAVAKTIGLSQEDLQTAIDTKGTIAVPLECFAQSEASSEVLEAASFNQEAEPMARMQKNAQDVIQRMQELVEKAADHQIKMVDIISRELFPEETQQATVNRELVQAAIIENPENPALGLKTLIEKYKAQKMAILEPALKFLDDTSGNGTVIVPIDDEGHTVRLSENAKWYQDFWKEFGRKPTKAELVEIAEGMVTGKSNIEYWTITSEEEEQQAKDIMLDIAELNHKLQLLENIKPKMQGINGVEMRLTEGLSAEAYKVYRILNEQLKNAPGTASRAGRISAILFARHADIFAKAMRENGAADYTALDYLKQHQVVFNQDLNGGMNQAMFDLSKKGITSLDEFATRLPELENNGTAPSKVMWTDKTTGVIYPGAQLKHAIRKHNLTNEDLDNIQNGLDNITDVYTSKQAEGRFHGIPIFGKFSKGDTLYFVCLEVRSDGTVVFLTASQTNNDLYETYKKEHGSERLTPPNGAVPDSNHVPYSFSIQDLVERVKLKNKNIFNQMADYYDVNIDNYEIKEKGSLQRGWPDHNSGAVAKNPSKSAFILSDWLEKVNMLETDFRKNIFSQMAGERAAVNLDMGQGTLLAKLREAQSMNATEEEIYKKTGWILGADGKWRFEIPDNLDAIDYSVLHENGEAKLSEVYDNPKLYIAYPQLRDIPVMMENGMENSAGSTNGLRIRLAPKAGKTTLLHEIQHIIQGYENFASGGSPDSVINRIEDRAYSLKKTIEGGFKSDTGDVFRLLEDYDNAKQGMVRAMRSRKRGEAAQLKGLMQELKGKIADSCRNPKDVDSIISAYYERKKLTDILTEYRNTPSNERPAMREKLYRQLAGEQEAVFTEKRALSANTEDMPVPHGYDAVVVFDGKSQALSIKNDTGVGFSTSGMQLYIPAEKLAPVERPLQRALDEFTAQYPDGTIAHTSIGDVRISRRDIKNSLSHGLSPKKIAVISTLKDGIEKAEHVLSMADYDNKQKRNHFFVYTVNVAGEENFVLCRITEQQNQRRLYVHEVANREEIKKISDSLLTRAVTNKSNPVPRGIALYASILSDYVAKVDSKKAEIFNQGVRGQSAPLSTGGYIMSLLQTADESTFLHESGHLFLWDLEQLAGFGGQYAEDWRVVREWASYKNGAEKLYKGTPFEKEFATLAQNIRAAEDAGDVNTADSLKRRWMHERFARGFEMYLKQGKAPSKGLQSVFRKFKQFLKTIYIAFTGEGVRANPTVERVMARMIASEDEIEAAELDDRFKDISKAGGEKLMGESTQETYQRWWDEAKEEAKERLMKILMQDLEEEKIRKFSEVMTNERSRMRKELEQLPLYLAQKIISETGNKNAAVELGFYDSVEAYEAELNEMPSLSQALDDYMMEFARAKDKEIMQAKVSEEKIAELIQQTHYHKKLMALETEIMKSKEEAVNKINAKAKAAMDELDESIKALNDDIDIQLERKTDKSIKKVIDAINKLRFSTRWTPAELARIDDIIHSATKQEMSQALKEFTKQAGEWKKNLKAVQEAFNGRMKMMKKMAEQDLAGRSIAEACSYNTYVTREKKAAKLVDKMVRAGKWDVAMVQQEARFTSAALADAAKKNQEHVNKLLNTIEKQLKARTVKLPKEEKYWHRQLAYLLHLIPEAPERPEECPDLKDIFTGLNESLDIDFNIGSIYDIITQESFTGYRSLTIAQLEEVVNAMTVLYKILAGLRSNAGFAIMGFRMWPAIENITNILPMMDQVGAKNALMAISDFYTDFRKNRELINLSPFMRERADSIDRDIRSVKAPFEGSGPVSGWLKQYAYFPLVVTDRMLSEPLWCRVYKSSIEKNFIAVHEENQRQLARFRMAQEKAQELRGQMADLVSERAKLRNSLQEDEANDVPYTPDALRHITAAKIRIAEIEKALEPMNKELWAAERDIDLLENIEVKSQNDILEEAKELSVRDADAAVRNAFGSGKTKDLAPALREKSELMKMFTVFISYFNTQMNAIALSYYGGKFAREDLTGLQNLGRWMPLIRSLMYRIFLTALIGSLLKMALTGDGSDDKHKYRKVKDAEGDERTEEIPLLERFLVQFGKNLVSTATGSLIGIREITAVLNNLVFEGTDYGRSVGGTPIAFTCADKVLKTFKLAMAKADKDAEIEESERKKKEKYAKMTPAARKKFDDEQKYKKPPKRINYIDIFKEFGGAVVSATAARTGVTDTIANIALTTLQYMFDGDGRYDSTLSNIVWSAFWNKKPVEREVPKKPEEPKKKKKGAKK